MSYADFLARKAIIDPPTGIDPPALSPALFPHQADIVRWALRRGRAAIFAGTGLGKSLMELSWADAIVRETGKPALIMAPLAVSAQMVREADKFGIGARLARTQADVDGPGVVVTNYHKIEHFDLRTFGAVVLDECFAPDTLVDVVSPSGIPCARAISDVCVGDKILNAAGVDRVGDVHRREVPYAIRVRFGPSAVMCSPNHPWMTQRGWIAAQDLEPGDELVTTTEAMRLVRSADDREAAQATVLRQVLLSEMADASAGALGESPHSGGRGETRGRTAGLVCARRGEGRGRAPKDCRTEPHKQAGGARETLPRVESHGPRTFRAWGQWAGDDASAEGFAGCALRRMDAGVCLVTGPADAGLSHALQDRLGRRRAESRYRGGWAVSRRDDPARAGRTQGSAPARYGVDGIEVLEPGHPDLDRYRDADGKLYFYDLGGTRHPSFSVAGALVHNSSILKSQTGHYRTALIEQCANIPFRLAATATPAPNDFMELGNHAEFLGVLSYTDMLATFFTHDGSETQKWRLKGHAEQEFWKWMASWAVMLRKPSDLGYPNDGYDLPPLNAHQHIVAPDYGPSVEMGTLFPMQAHTLQERIAARRGSVADRVAKAVAITPADRPFVWWCNLNAESEALAKAIPGAVETKGSDSEDDKERKILDFLEGRTRVLVSKPGVCGFGMNFQHCADTGFVGLSDSFEQVFQAIRRFWRFGQTMPVNVHFIASEVEGAVVANLKRKEADAERMAANMVRHMADLSAREVRGATRDKGDYNPTKPMRLPDWMEGGA